jgi:hypothetical protein
VPITAATPPSPWRTLTVGRGVGRCSRSSASETVADPTSNGNQIALLHTYGTALLRYAVVPVTT